MHSHTGALTLLVLFLSFLSAAVAAPQPAAPALPGLSPSQSKHARLIASLAPSRAACVVAIMTALQESKLAVLANKSIPESYNIPHEGDGQDYDSVGIFQQRPTWWGTVAELMDPATSAKKFFAALVAVPGWEAMSPGAACQAVQRSEHPDRYAKWEGTGREVCNAIWNQKW